MSTIKTKNVQVGTDGTASNNFTIYVPGTPDGTVRIGNGDAGSVTDAVTINSSGAVTLANNLTVTGTASINGSNISTQPSFRNLIINGDMKIAQRGTSATSLSSNGYFTVDRWKAIHGVNLGVWTNEQSTDVPSGQGFSYSFKSTCTTADASPSAGDIVQVIQEIEGQNMVSLKKGTANAESVTLSFWVKSNVTGTYTIEWRDADNNRHICASYSITASDTWEKKTITFAGDTVSAFVYDNSTCGNIGFCYGAGSNFTSGTLATSWASRNTANIAVGQVNVGASTSNYFQLTGIQLEVGENATPFEHRPYDMELQRCMRYYEQYTGANSHGGLYSGSVYIGHIQYKVRKRTRPTLTATGSGYTSISNSSGGDEGGTDNMFFNGGASTYITTLKIDAEL